MAAVALYPLAAWFLSWRATTALLTYGAALTVLARRIQIKGRSR